MLFAWAGRPDMAEKRVRRKGDETKGRGGAAPYKKPTDSHGTATTIASATASAAR